MENERDYTELNSRSIDKWVAEGWEWGVPITHEQFSAAQHGDWDVLLTPARPVPHEWFCEMRGAAVLGLACGGGQQMPVFTALGAVCTVLDYSAAQLESERMVAQREGYDINIVRADMTQPLPFADCSFDLIFHPVSNSYVRDVMPIWRECQRILKPGGILLAGTDNGFTFAFDEDETTLKYRLPFDPLADRQLYDDCIAGDWGIQFSHTAEEQLGGQLKAGLTLTDILEDTGTCGRLHEFNIPMFYMTRAVK